MGPNNKGNIMMNIVENAKELIKKGKELNDLELVAMGTEMLKKYDTTPDYGVVRTITQSAKYVCQNCGYETEYDKPNRKQCPKCKKHKLQLIEPKLSNPNRIKADDFNTQVRDVEKSRIKYDENNNPIGIIAMSQQIGKIQNLWDDDKTEGFDKDNEVLKKYTKVSPRTRKPAKMKEVVCEKCQNKYTVHPLHAAGRSRFLCDRCIQRRSKA